MLYVALASTCPGSPPPTWPTVSRRPESHLPPSPLPPRSPFLLQLVYFREYGPTPLWVPIFEAMYVLSRSLPVGRAGSATASPRRAEAGERTGAAPHQMVRWTAEESALLRRLHADALKGPLRARWAEVRGPCAPTFCAVLSAAMEGRRTAEQVAHEWS